MSISKLLPEVLQLVLQNLSRNDVYKCIRVCKLWKAIAYLEFYKVIPLSSHNVDIIVSKLQEREGDGFKHWFQGGRLVKALQCYASDVSKFQTNNLFTFLLSCLPIWSLILLMVAATVLTILY